VTYTIFGEGNAERPFDPAVFDVFPQDWLDAAPGVRITSALIRVEELADEADIAKKVGDWFVGESMAMSSVVEDTCIIGGDFRIDGAGHMRFAVFVRPDTGPRRIGRVVQRVCEIETYKTMSMLGLARARVLSGRLGEIDTELTCLVDAMGDNSGAADETLHALLKISAELENLMARSSFRFSATAAYEALVHQRIAVLRENRFLGRQTFREFMMRRFDPAMRTVKSTQERLESLALAATRAGELLRTRVDVERSAQNQELLASMDKRADLQLRLQKTVEGLSVVAISYYAVNLVLYAFGPLAARFDIDKPLLAAGSTPLVVLAVWFVVRQIRKSMH
jgi:uncharacterized membrane-anchored protein